MLEFEEAIGRRGTIVSLDREVVHSGQRCEASLREAMKCVPVESEHSVSAFDAGTGTLEDSDGALNRLLDSLSLCAVEGAPPGRIVLEFALQLLCPLREAMPGLSIWGA